MKIVLTPNEKIQIQELAASMEFPIDAFISSDGYTIHLSETAVLQKIRECTEKSRVYPTFVKKNKTNSILNTLAKHFPNGFIRK